MAAPIRRRLVVGAVVAALSALMVADAAWYDVPSIEGRQILIYGKPFYVRGVCYSPVPVNESMLFGPYGDYFTDEYAFLWRRDLPLIRAMGANAIRIYGWDDLADHTLFLDYVLSMGLRVLITFPLGSASTTPVRGDANRKKVVDRFAAQVHKYGEHPSILAWSFGNEINMREHGFLQEFDREFVCGWNVHDEKLVRARAPRCRRRAVATRCVPRARAMRAAAPRLSTSALPPARSCHRRAAAIMRRVRQTRPTRVTTRPTASTTSSSAGSSRPRARRMSSR